MILHRHKNGRQSHKDLCIILLTIVPTFILVLYIKNSIHDHGNVEYLTLAKYELYTKTSWVVDYGCGFLVKYYIDYFNNLMPS